MPNVSQDKNEKARVSQNDETTGQKLASILDHRDRLIVEKHTLRMALTSLLGAIHNHGAFPMESDVVSNAKKALKQSV